MRLRTRVTYTSAVVAAAIYLICWLSVPYIVWPILDLWYAEQRVPYVQSTECATYRPCVDARVNGIWVRFLVDTGSTYTVLSLRDAHSVGIDVAAGDSGTIQGIGGTAPAKRTVLKSVRIGSVDVSDVPALITTNDGTTNFLGMSFLTRLQRVEFNKNGMVFKQEYFD